MNLTLDRDHLGAQRVIGCESLLDTGAVDAVLNCYPRLPEQSFALILVDVHDPATPTPSFNDAHAHRAWRGREALKRGRTPDRPWTS